MKFFKFKRKSFSSPTSSSSSSSISPSTTSSTSTSISSTSSKSSRPSLPSLPALPRQLPSFIQTKHEPLNSAPSPEFTPLLDVIDTQKEKNKKNESFADSVFASLEALYSSTDLNDFDSSIIHFDEPHETNNIKTKESSKHTSPSSTPGSVAVSNLPSRVITPPPRLFNSLSPPRPFTDQTKEANIQALLGMVTPPSSNQKSNKSIKVTSPPSPTPTSLPRVTDFSTASNPFSQSGQKVNKSNFLHPISPSSSPNSTSLMKSNTNSTKQPGVFSFKNESQFSSSLASSVNPSTTPTNNMNNNDTNFQDEDDEKIIAAILRRRSLKLQIDRRPIPKSNSSSSSSSSSKDLKRKATTSQREVNKNIFPPRSFQASK